MTKKNDIERLFKTHYVEMHRLAVLYLHDNDLARDIVHDVFVTMLDNFSDTHVSPSYLRIAVRNRCLNHLRDCEMHQRIANRWFLENEDYDSENWPDEETIARINHMIESCLTPQERRIIDLRFSEGRPFAMVANIMGISETAVYRHLRHALMLIRNKLCENG